MDFLRIAGAQLNLTVGDLEGNRDRIIDAMAWAEGVQADILLLPELAISGYPPEDLVLRDAFVARNIDILDDIASQSDEMISIVGFVDRAPAPAASTLDDAVPRRLADAAAIVAEGKVRGVYHKGLLPNYGVFDEDRYFLPGTDCGRVWDVGGIVVGVSVCEDIWVPDGPHSLQAGAGAQVLLNISASPYHAGKGGEREMLLVDQARRTGLPLVYVNLVGGQDELVFDGQSVVVDSEGNILYRAPQFQEQLFWVDVPVPPRRPGVIAEVVGHRTLLEGKPETPSKPVEPLDEEAEVYAALVLGLRDYVQKNGFSAAFVGLSGGIDSALTATIAVDALGPDAVWGVTMPGPYSSLGSVDDSAELARRLGIRIDRIPIDDVFTEFLKGLEHAFEGTESGVAEENLQARIRGALLMALSNKFGGIVVATGNKSELAVGYATLYGDMAGGFAVLKDVFKTMVYRLAEWRNRDGDVIPQAILEKAPSAELSPGQLDSDSLPPYELLDLILEAYVEQDESVEAIVAGGFDRDTVTRVAEMVDRNEYKRRQAAPGVKITAKAFGKDRRLPITNQYRRRR